MFRSILSTIVVMALATMAFTQNSVQLTIEHYLQDQPFALGDESMTHDRQTFNVTRLEYYLDQISVTNQNGNSYQPDSLWVLVDASQPTEISLGSYAMDSVVSVTFHIGVDSAYNHLDPAEWPAEHPLAHKDPSMHWGWANGYRFNAMEGMAGDELNQEYQLHGLGDENYFSVTIDVAVGAEGGTINVPIYANYAEILRGLDVEDGLISHGPIYEAQTSLENMRDHVFGAEVPESTVEDPDPTGLGSTIKLTDLTVYPNPTSDFVHFSKQVNGYLTDLTGRQVLRFNRASSVDLTSVPRGTYFLLFDDYSARRISIE